MLPQRFIPVCATRPAATRRAGTTERDSARYSRSLEPLILTSRRRVICYDDFASRNYF